MHRSLFVASYFNHSIAENYAGLRNMLVEITKIGLEGAICLDFLFMHDNVQPHRSVEDARSRRVAQETIHPCAAQEMKTALRQEWDNILQGLLDSLVKRTDAKCA
ncbi:hypothetical protein TNCV_2370971 [Trichonephila clavipes]|nr:hypothetical protein TNCV_2370971 [Trichonephila clavipes]